MMEIINSCAFSELCGIDSSNQIPDGDTIGRLRTLLVKHGLQERLFTKVVVLLSLQELILRRGIIVYSSIIAAPSSMQNREKKRHPDAHQTKNGNSWYFGYKVDMSMDKVTQFVHHVEVTGANVHDVTVVPELLTGGEMSVYGDSGYLGAEKTRGRYHPKCKREDHFIQDQP